MSETPAARRYALQVAAEAYGNAVKDKLAALAEYQHIAPARATTLGAVETVLASVMGANVLLSIAEANVVRTAVAVLADEAQGEF